MSSKNEDRDPLNEALDALGIPEDSKSVKRTFDQELEGGGRVTGVEVDANSEEGKRLIGALRNSGAVNIGELLGQPTEDDDCECEACQARRAAGLSKSDIKQRLLNALENGKGMSFGEFMSAMAKDVLKSARAQRRMRNGGNDDDAVDTLRKQLAVYDVKYEFKVGDIVQIKKALMSTYLNFPKPGTPCIVTDLNGDASKERESGSKARGSSRFQLGFMHDRGGLMFDWYDPMLFEPYAAEDHANAAKSACDDCDGCDDNEDDEDDE